MTEVGTLQSGALSPERQVEQKIRYGSLTNRHLELILFPTEQCNFRCTYCYEDFAIGRMGDDVISGVRNLMSRRAPKLERLHLSYFGGEPLLNMRAIRAISSHGRALETAFGLTMTSSMTTNAFLLDADCLAELLTLNCTSYQISLDGWSTTHDKTRRQRNKKGSFETIWNNLLAVKRTNFEFHYLLRVHLMPENMASVFELVRNINAHLDDDRFEIMFKKVGEWGGTNVEHPVVFEDGSMELAEAYDRLVQSAKRVSDVGVEEFGGTTSTGSSSPNSVQGRVDAPKLPYVCYASKANSFAVRANGRINKCTVALSNPKNDIGSINADGTLQLDPDKLAPWLGGVGTLDEHYLGCPASKVLAS